MWTDYIAQAVGGDVRKALGAVELLVSVRGRTASRFRGRSGRRSARICATTATVTAIMTSLSALQKSVRGSDPDAALHYLARLLEAKAI